jgi:hypothetical protein
MLSRFLARPPAMMMMADTVGPRLRRKCSKYIKRKGRLGQTLGVAGGESSLNSPRTEECRDRTDVRTDNVATFRK